MEFLAHLWLPILVSGVVVWIVSFLCWMVIGHHKKDTLAIPKESEFIDTIRRMGIAPGDYMFPEPQSCRGMTKEERTRWAKEKWVAGAMGHLRVWADPSMSLNMFLTFLFFLVASAVLAYLGWAVLPHGSIIGVNVGGTTIAAGMAPTFAKVFQVIATGGILAYCFASFPNDLWFQKSRRAMVMNFIDGVVYALITATIFAYFWPK
ncbi:MAG TPA: hypothetical protein PKE29_03565 [Phycisphaerales bacterium]|nr:hypothetical protein [Phycisphaerales bacterium]